MKKRFLLGFLATLLASSAQAATTTPDITRLGLSRCTTSQFLMGGGAGLAPLCVTSIPSATAVAGFLAITNIATPTAPAAGIVDLYSDTTCKTMMMRNDASTIAAMVVPQQPTNQVFTSLSSCGVLTASAVTNATLSTMVTSTVKGNFSGGTTTPSDAAVPSCANDGTHALTNNGGIGFNCVAITGVTATPPTTFRFTSGTDLTYTRSSASVRWIEVTMVGGGGGGVGSGAGPGGSNNGNPTCWKASGTACTTPLYQGSGGTGGTSTDGGVGGGIAGSATCDDSATGSPGGAGTAVTNSIGGKGGSTSMGPGAAAAYGVPVTAPANGGGGGAGGGSTNTAIISGSGGGGGGTCHFIIGNPAATYVYTVGTGGAGGTAGASGNGGGTAAAGRISVIEHYNY